MSETNRNIDTNYNCNAPMWVDFPADTYTFDNTNASNFDLGPNDSSNYFDVSESETTLIGQDLDLDINSIEMMKMTPVKVVSPKHKWGNVAVIKETTVEHLLNDVIELASSIKKQSKCRTPKPNNEKLFPTSSGRAVRQEEMVRNQSLVMEKICSPSNVNVDKSQVANEDKREQEKPTTEPLTDPNTHKEAIDEEKDEDYEEVFEVVKNFETYHRKKSRLAEQHERNRAGTIGVSVLTSHARRRSSIMKGRRRRRSNQYISFAESVRKFQTGTPTRFHTVGAKNANPKPLQEAKRQEFKPTVAKSPAFVSKKRVRRNTALSRQQSEEIQLQQMKQHKIRANPVPKCVYQAPQPLQSVSTKPLTCYKPFQLTKLKGSQNHSNSHTRSDKEKFIQSGCANKTIDSCKKTIKRVVPTVINSQDGITVTETEIMHFGIPAQLDGSTKRKTTKPLPFNFQVRTKLFSTDKPAKSSTTSQIDNAKKSQVQNKSMVVAKPSTSNDNTQRQAKQTEKAKVKVVPFSFDARDKAMLEKKEQLRKQMEEEMKKRHTFFAAPVPEFKPVMVRGRSKENIKRDDKVFGKSRNRSAEPKSQLKLTVRAHSADNLKILGACNLIKSDTAINKSGNDENKPPNHQIMPVLKQSLKNLPGELHADKRSQLKLNRALRDEKRKKEQNEKLAKEKMEIRELRKKAEIKARPMPVYNKANTFAKSAKPSTATETSSTSSHSK